MGPTPVVTCALEGCGIPIVRHDGGGRPRLYCSDAHRAEARRRRLTGRFPASPAPGDPIVETRRLLGEALAQLDQVAATGRSRDDALFAEARLRATEELLGAQQLAAEAARTAAQTHDRLEAERTAWHAVRRTMDARHDADAATIDELRGALEGARSELEGELVRHHHDVESLEARLQAQAGAHGAEKAALRAERAALEQRLHAETAAAREAERRARVAEEDLGAAREAAVALEVRAAWAEEQARQAGLRLQDADAALKQARADLAAARRVTARPAPRPRPVRS